jgi:hypothetical protein
VAASSGPAGASVGKRSKGAREERKARGREGVSRGSYPLVRAVGRWRPSPHRIDGRGSARQLPGCLRKTTGKEVGPGHFWAAPEEEERKKELGCQPNLV